MLLNSVVIPPNDTLHTSSISRRQHGISSLNDVVDDAILGTIPAYTMKPWAPWSSAPKQFSTDLCQICSCKQDRLSVRIRRIMNPAVTLHRRERICDFCSNPNPVSMFRSEAVISVKFADLPDLSSGKWWACETCARLIDHEQWDELADRGTEVICRNNKANVEDEQWRRTRRGVLELHSLFRRYRTEDSAA